MFFQGPTRPPLGNGNPEVYCLAGRDCPTHGYCGCPLIVGDRLFVQPGGPNGKAIAALDIKDGSVLWQALDDPIAPSTPVSVEVRGNSQVIFFTGAGAVGVDPQDGDLLWRYPWKTRFDLNIATPSTGFIRRPAGRAPEPA